MGKKVNVQKGKQGFQRTSKAPDAPTAADTGGGQWTYEPGGPGPVTASEYTAQYEAFRAAQAGSGAGFGVEVEYSGDFSDRARPAGSGEQGWTHQPGGPGPVTAADYPGKAGGSGQG